MNPNALRVISPGEIDRAEELLSQQLRRLGMRRTKERSTILRVFLQTAEPISAHELLCLVKKDDVFTSFTTVYRMLKTIVACGLGKEVICADAIARYLHDHCSHRHLVCKDCGAAVDAEAQNASREVTDAELADVRIRSVAPVRFGAARAPENALLTREPASYYEVQSFSTVAKKLYTALVGEPERISS